PLPMSVKGPNPFTSPTSMSDIQPADLRFPEPRREEGIRPPPSWPQDDSVEPARPPLPECDFSLVGQELRERRHVPVASVLFGVLTFVMLVLALNNANYHVALAAVLPAAFTVTLFGARRPRFSCAITPAGLAITRPPLTLDYAQIQVVSAPE